MAIDPSSGHLFASSTPTQVLLRYATDTAAWDRVNEQEELILGEPEVIIMRNSTGEVLLFDSMQGGVFSESGQLLYLVSGFLDAARDSDGIHVFDTATWRRIRQSSRSKMPFKYEFHPGWDSYEEAEGLTIWDLDDDRAPGIRGTLHVLMLDNDYPLGEDDQVYLKHYTESVYVDGAYTGDEYGRLEEPFNTVTEANDMVWDGQRIWIRTGSYPETLTFSKRLEILALDGPVIIGE